MTPGRINQLFVGLAVVILLLSACGGGGGSSPTDSTPPSQVTALSLTTSSVSTITLSWAESSDNVGVVSYEVLVNDNVVASTAQTHYTVTGLNAATPYNITVKAVDAAGNRSAVSAILIATTASTPSNSDFGTHVLDTHKVTNFNQYIDNDFVLFWPYPSRAYPGLPLDFQFIVYEAFKQPLHWQVVSGPAGMTITQEGLLQWTPSPSQLGDQAVTIKVTRESGESITKSFTTNVNTSDFVFVSLTGNDTASGQLDAPLRTIEKALRSIESGNGKTIYVRQGTYAEHYNWEVNGVTAPTRGKAFTADDPLVVSSYPGEHFILDCEFLGHGFYSTARYSIYKNLEVKNAGVGERAGALIQADNNVLQNVTVRDSKWDVWDNVTGIKVSGKNAIVDRVTAINNQDPIHIHWNSSNYLVYTDGVQDGPVSNIYILRSQSRDSFTGFKIKHAGPGFRVIVHDCYSENDRIGFGGSSDFSSVRYSTFKNNVDGNINLGLTDPTSPVSNGSDQSFTGGSMLVEHNTFINEASVNLDIFGLYAGSSIIQKNIFVTNSIGGIQQFSVWIYTDDMSTLNLTVDKNIYFNHEAVSAGVNSFRWSRSNQTFAQWQARGYDLNGKVADPEFIDSSYGINSTSPAVFGNTDYAGANPPLKP